jgi:hypothetical protein
MENVMTEHERCEECGGQHGDPLKNAAWPLAEFILNMTNEKSLARGEAMNALMASVETIRSILAKSHMH